MKHIVIWKRIMNENVPSRYIISNAGNVFDTVSYSDIRGYPNAKGYINIPLFFDGCHDHVKWYKLHRLVAEIFLENPENKPDVNHIDGNKENNSVWNLEWVTKQENVRHAFDTGLHPIYTCEDSSHHKYTNAEINSVCQFMMDYPEVTLRRVEELFGIGYATLQNLRLHRSWKEISENYDFPKRLDFEENIMLRESIDAYLLSGLLPKEIIKRFKPNGYDKKRFSNLVYSRKYQLRKDELLE